MSITKSVKLFTCMLQKYENNIQILKYFLCWLHFYIEREKRRSLPQLMNEHRLAWRKLKLLKSNEKPNQSDIVKQENTITEKEKKIDEASFSIEHFFREIGHMNEAILELDKDCAKLALPPSSQMSKIIGGLVADGHQFEIIDGESFYMPYKWIKNVVNEVNQCIGAGKVLVLSVLGLQSSGKSTFLNTMFGCQFSTRTGRCTSGIHAQLIPIDTAQFKDKFSDYNFILVVDTEGLRSPDLSHFQHEHDNELATAITGIRDITLINIMGENTSEIRDILQVITHAFLRLKMIKKELDLKKSCSFIHQNVTDTSASANMMTGLSKLIQTLDEMTKESAESENIRDVTTFNQVIEFDSNSQVWYLKNLWQGNPPMARVNSEYSERVIDIKSSILKKALMMKDKSYKSLSDITEHAHNIWKGVLNENFVFSFKNSIEIKAYMAMEHAVQNQLWRLESLIRDGLIKISQKSFASCEQEENLYTVANKVIKNVNNLLLEEKTKSEEEINKYFENDKYKDIIVQWQTSQKQSFDIQCQQLEQTVKDQIKTDLEKREIEILTVTCHEKHEEELRRMSMQVANEYEGPMLSNEDINKLFFKRIWQSFLKKVNTTTSNVEKKRKPMRDIFETYLINKFQKHSQIIRQVLNHSENLTPLPNLTILKGSFKHTGIDENDINFTWTQKGIQFMYGTTDVMSYIETKVNQVFETVDFKIQQCCQVREEITEMSVNKLMHDLESTINDILKGDIEYKFQTHFYVKMYVHVSRHVHSVFEKHNENYFKTYGAAACLEKYRAQQTIRFEAHLRNRHSEDTIAKLFVNIIDSFAEEWTLQTLPNKVTDELYTNLPSVKNRAIIEICTDLLKQGIFEDFIKYIQAPKNYASTWVTLKANKYLFAQESNLYSKLSTLLVRNVFLEVNTSVREVLKKFEKLQKLSTDQWVQSFQTFMEASDFSISTDRFRSMKNETEYIQNLEFFTNEILNSLKKTEENVLCRFYEVDSSSVQWSNSSPIERIIQKIWGCPEQCAFCGEPCAKSEDHKGSEHNCVQHRPLCCRGVRSPNTLFATLPSCEFRIQSDETHKCCVFDYKCNSDKQQNCDEQSHRYKDYKTVLKEWYIAPSANMHDTSKYWMWFVANYKERLHKYYGYEFNDIPTSWYEITESHALQSLSEIYSA